MTLILKRSDLIGLVTMGEVVAAVEAAHAEVARGTALQPAPTALSLAADAPLFLAMAALSGAEGLAVVKALADTPANAAVGLPVQRSVVVLVSQATGACEAILHGEIPTRLRTAAASAVASRHLSRPDSRVLGLVGAGKLAAEHVNAHLEVRPIDEVVVWSRTLATAETFAMRVGEEHPRLRLEAVASPREVTQRADILCTLTPSREAVVEGAWFHPGLHVNAVGAPPRPDHREIDSAGMARARVFLDSVATARHESGDLLLAVADGTLAPDSHYAELGQVIIGAAAGRTSPDDVTLYNSVGLAIQDLAIGKLILARALERGAGIEIDLSG